MDHSSGEKYLKPYKNGMISCNKKVCSSIKEWTITLETKILKAI